MIVFDIDDLVTCIVYRSEIERVRQQAKELLGEERLEQLSVTVMDHLHLVFPGFYAVFRWLREQGHAFHFFSSGVEERNAALVPELIARAFGAEAEAVMRDVRVFSRQHCFDTSRWELRDQRDQYQPFNLFGNLKKILRDVVVPAEQLPNTLLIEDDPSYMPKGEEENMILLPSSLSYIGYHPGEPEEWKSFHKAYLLCGLLETIFERARARGISLTKASVEVHTNSETEAISPEALRAIRDVLAYYNRGLEILRVYDASLRFFVELDSSA